jgi:hypothetical protein
MLRWIALPLLAGALLSQSAGPMAARTGSPLGGNSDGQPVFVGNWAVMLRQGVGTARFARCEAERSYPNGSVLHLEWTPGPRFALRFITGGAGPDRLPERFRLRYWVDNEGARSAMALSIPDAPLSARLDGPLPAGFLDTLATGRELFITAEGMSLRFPIDGVAEALAFILSGCV